MLLYTVVTDDRKIKVKNPEDKDICQEGPWPDTKNLHDCK